MKAGQEISTVEGGALREQSRIGTLRGVGLIQRTLEGLHVGPAVQLGAQTQLLPRAFENLDTFRKKTTDVVDRLAKVAARSVLVLLRPQKGSEEITTHRAVEMTGQVGEQGADLL